MPSLSTCKSINCNHIVIGDADFCSQCISKTEQRPTEGAQQSMAEQYPAYYKDVEHLDEIDVYMVHHLFQINDPSGAIQHASKKLLLSGVRTGGKSTHKDIREARDTLTRWLQINKETPEQHPQ